MTDENIMSMDSTEIFYLRTHGIMFFGKLNQEIPYGYKGNIKINGCGGGNIFKVIAIEMFSIARPDNVIYDGEQISILVGQPSGYVSEGK